MLVSTPITWLFTDSEEFDGVYLNSNTTSDFESKSLLFAGEDESGIFSHDDCGRGGCKVEFWEFEPSERFGDGFDLEKVKWVDSFVKLEIVELGQQNVKLRCILSIQISNRQFHHWFYKPRMKFKHCFISWHFLNSSWPICYFDWVDFELYEI